MSHESGMGDAGIKKVRFAKYRQELYSVGPDHTSIDEVEVEKEEEETLWERAISYLTASHDKRKIKPRDLPHLLQRSNIRIDRLSWAGDRPVDIPPCDTYYMSTNDDRIRISEHESPMNLLLRIGFTADESWAAVKNVYLKARLEAAIREARVWVNRVTRNQGTLLYLLAIKSTPNIHGFFIQIAEAIVNDRITTMTQLYDTIRILQKFRDNELGLEHLFERDMLIMKIGKSEFEMIKEQYYAILQIVAKEARKWAHLTEKRVLDQDAMAILATLSANYRPQFDPHLKLMAKYIGLQVLRTEMQLRAAMQYLQMTETAEEVDIRDFEICCGLTSKTQRETIVPKLKRKISK